MTRKQRSISIKSEKAACIRAFKKYPRAKYAWCLHHEVLYERIADKYDRQKDLPGWRGRIKYIEKFKSRFEQARRFRNFRPVKGRAVRLTWAKLNKEWPNNTWNGWSIFGVRSL